MIAAPAARRPRLLIVDDGDGYVELAHHFLRGYDYATRCELTGPCWTCPRRPGCTLTHAHDLAEAEQALAQHRDVDVVLLDVRFDLPSERLAPSSEFDVERRRRLQGLDILAQLRRAHGDLPVVLMTSEEELVYEEAAAALAVDEYVTLAGADSFDAAALGLLVERVLARRPGRSTVADGAGSYWWGGTRAMARLRREALVLARTSLPMLLLGETGCGKSALAERVIHPATRRRGPFVAVDLSALPPTLVAAELLGTARGAFSGAVEREGRVERAAGGTLFLDEIGNLPLDLQRTLLLTLDGARVTRLGESAARSVDVKLVAATNADLAAAVRAGTFRADLYARLNPAAALTLPPLRERAPDIDALVRHFLDRAFREGADRSLLASYVAAADLDGPPRFAVAPATLRLLRSHRWPGNVRELERLVVTAAVSALADALTAVEEGRPPLSARELPLPAKLVRDLVSAGDAAATPRAAATATLTLPRPAPSLREVSRALERQLFAQLFEETGGDFAAMARRLLLGDGAANARRVRLRFNQLGLRVGRPER